MKILSTTLKTAGSQTITATDVNTGAINGTTPGITVNVGATSTLTVVPAAFTQTAGTAFNVTVTAKDAGGNTTTTYTGTAHFTSTDLAVSPGSGLPNPDSGVHVFSVTLQTSGARTVTATDNVTGAINGTTGSITVNPGAAASLTVAPAGTTQTAAIAFNVTVTAKDAFGNTATGYAGTVQFTSTDGALSPGSGLPNNYHFLGGDLGVKTLSVTLKTAGPQTVTATDNVTGTINGTTPSITVNVGATSTFLVVPGAFTQTAGSSFSVTVTAKDAGGNTTTTYTGTAHFNSTDLAVVGGSGLPMDYQFTSGGGLDNGVHVFTVTLKTVGTQTITVMDFNTLAITGTSGSITVNPGATTKLAVKGTSSIVAFPPGVVQGIANIVTVVAQDANNNTTPAYVGTVHFTTSDGAVSAGSGLPANYQFTSGGGMDNGIHVYSGGATLLTVNATASITATDTANGTINGAVTINVVAAPLVFQSAAAMIVGGSRDGQVFITGGSTTNDNAGTSTASTYFYNPSTGTMLPGPNMALARYAHTATATTGGQIVVAGGNYAKIGSIDHFEFELCGTDGASPSCAEVTGSTGSAKDTQRCNAAAALVRAGTVVIGGGDNCAGGGFLDQLDVWDSGAPTTTTFVNGVGHQFAVARHFHTATALGSSKVLFAGGGSTASADIFTLVVPPNIANSTVVATTAGMLVTRSGHSATTLRTTGTTACPVGPCVLIAGGNATAAKTWEIYDASTDTFPRNATTAGHDLQLAGRNEHAAAGFNNGRVLLAGGSNTPTGGGTAQSSTEYFDPAALTFSTFSALSETRLHPGFAYVTTDLLIVIGGNTTTPTLVLGSPVDQASTP